MKPRGFSPVLGCLGPVQLRFSQKFSRGPKSTAEYTGTTARRTSSLWIPSWCWPAIHKPPGNVGESWPRQNSRRVTMWRQCNQHLSLARPQVLTTCPSVHWSPRSRVPSDEAGRGCQGDRRPVAALLRKSVFEVHFDCFFFTVCSEVAQQHSLPGYPCLNLSLPLIPGNYSVTTSNGKSRWLLGSSRSLTWKNNWNTRIFTEPLEKHISEFRFNSPLPG